MQHKVYDVESDKQIHVFDNLFPFLWREQAYTFAMDSSYKIGWADSSIPERQPNGKYIHCKFGGEDLNNFGILRHLHNSGIYDKLFKGLNVTDSVINLSNSSDVNWVHSHYQKKILLYYINLEWPEGWHGETHFYSENLKEIQYSSPYTPGRMIIFDGSIPHTIRPQSTIATQYRLTFTCMFN